MVESVWGRPVQWERGHEIGPTCHYDVIDFAFVAKRRGHYDVTDFVFVAKLRYASAAKMTSRSYHVTITSSSSQGCPIRGVLLYI